MKTALVLGAGGFIGSHLVKRLKSEGYWVRGVDLKLPEFSNTEADEFLIYDLRYADNVKAVMRLDKAAYIPFPILQFSFHPIPYTMVGAHFDEVYQLAADMGGAGYIFTGEHDAEIMHNSATINLNVAHWAKEYGVGKIFYSSSACMYPKELQERSYGLKESDAYPADPDSEYGWEKLFSERLFLAYARNHGLDVRIARFHNIYGPEGTYKGGREKAPAAICRKVIEADNEIEIWGDGEQTRSFLYIDACIDAIRVLMESEVKEPINIGSSELVSINQLADLAIEFSGKTIEKKYDLTKPQGVRGRNSDNSLWIEKFGYEVTYPLRDGLEKTYNWILAEYGL